MIWRDLDLGLGLGLLCKVRARVRPRVTAPPRVTGDSAMTTAGLVFPLCPILLLLAMLLKQGIKSGQDAKSWG